MMNAETKGQLQDIADILQPAVDEGRVEVHGVKPKRERMTVARLHKMVADGKDRLLELGEAEVKELAEDVAVEGAAYYGSVCALQIADVLLRGRAGDILTLYAGVHFRVVPVTKRELAQALGVDEDAFDVGGMLEQVSDLARHRSALWSKLDNARANIHELEVKLEREQLKTRDCITRRELERALEVEPDSFTMNQLVARIGNLAGDLERAHANVRELAAQKVKAGRERARVPFIACHIAEAIQNSIGSRQADQGGDLFDLAERLGIAQEVRAELGIAGEPSNTQALGG